MVDSDTHRSQGDFAFVMPQQNTARDKPTPISRPFGLNEVTLTESETEYADDEDPEVEEADTDSLTSFSFDSDDIVSITSTGDLILLSSDVEDTEDPELAHSERSISNTLIESNASLESMADSVQETLLDSAIHNNIDMNDLNKDRNSPLYTNNNESVDSSLNYTNTFFSMKSSMGSSNRDILHPKQASLSVANVVCFSNADEYYLEAGIKSFISVTYNAIPLFPPVKVVAFIMPLISWFIIYLERLPSSVTKRFLWTPTFYSAESDVSERRTNPNLILGLYKSAKSKGYNIYSESSSQNKIVHDIRYAYRKYRLPTIIITETETDIEYFLEAYNDPSESQSFLICSAEQFLTLDNMQVHAKILQMYRSLSLQRFRKMSGFFSLWSLLRISQVHFSWLKSDKSIENLVKISLYLFRIAVIWMLYLLFSSSVSVRTPNVLQGLVGADKYSFYAVNNHQIIVRSTLSSILINWWHGIQYPTMLQDGFHVEYVRRLPDNQPLPFTDVRTFKFERLITIRPSEAWGVVNITMDSNDWYCIDIAVDQSTDLDFPLNDGSDNSSRLLSTKVERLKELFFSKLSNIGNVYSENKAVVRDSFATSEKIRNRAQSIIEDNLSRAQGVVLDILTKTHESSAVWKNYILVSQEKARRVKCQISVKYQDMIHRFGIHFEEGWNRAIESSLRTSKEHEVNSNVNPPISNGLKYFVETLKLAFKSVKERPIRSTKIAGKNALRIKHYLFNR
ncbi:hypothetical protein V1511DRAFT_505829 [Dipodascopsis uninucleata]